MDYFLTDDKKVTDFIGNGSRNASKYTEEAWGRDELVNSSLSE